MQETENLPVRLISNLFKLLITFDEDRIELEPLTIYLARFLKK
jgi:hypothetical protein